MIEFLVENWVTLVALIAAVCVGGYLLYVFIKMPSASQIEKVKEWLLYAVTEAERELGSGTGQLKLRYTYDMFLGKFPYLASTISFDTFSGLVDEVLDKFKNMLSSNKDVANYVEKKGDN